ncbi:hypothetical protein Pan97_11110 [Bremerella volcania]|uniref:Uncharacterized protein n=1 Tax=Bremerella volcania TaxID=2527984 RepID=A0A518C4G3_9BACT|nr:hypothetical protein Pan97_11110 [Bremerella volcania]
MDQDNSNDAKSQTSEENSKQPEILRAEQPPSELVRPQIIHNTGHDKKP